MPSGWQKCIKRLGLAPKRTNEMTPNDLEPLRLAVERYRAALDRFSSRLMETDEEWSEARMDLLNAEKRAAEIAFAIGLRLFPKP